MSAAVVSTIRTMARWEPNARGRLEQAAMELYAERGFDQTTVAEIAARAGLTERTFFRHYADERAASLAAQTGIAVFHVAFGRWVGDGNNRGLPALIRETLGELKALTADRQSATASARASSL